jgi:hypothetical protein
MSTHTISDSLKLTTVLREARRAFARTILPITAFSTRYERVALQGNDTMAVPFYPLMTTKSKKRQPRGSYKALAHNTQTESREVVVNRNMVQAISFTSEQKSRQPFFDPAMHGQLMGEQLALDVMADIFRIVSHGRFSGTSIAATTKANFDENDVAEIAEICDTEHWPSMARSLIMRPAFGYNLVKQPALLDQSQSGSGAVLRQAQLPPIMGFDTFRSAGMPSNNLDGLVFTTTHANDVLNIDDALFADPTNDVLSDYFQNGDAVVLTTSAVDLPNGLTAATRYYVINVDDTNDTLQLCTTKGVSGTAVTFSDDGTGTHTITRTENIGAIVTAAKSAILVGFAPIELTPAMKKALFEHQIVSQKGSDIVLEYRHFADGDTGEEVQVIEAHYGVGHGDTSALKIIEQTPS